jgi:hypothetical protein
VGIVQAIPGEPAVDNRSSPVYGSSMDESSAPNRPPDCLKCVHFRITWDPAFPRSCTVFGIKSARLPSTEVFIATGKQCPSFSRKQGLK